MPKSIAKKSFRGRGGAAPRAHGRALPARPNINAARRITSGLTNQRKANFPKGFPTSVKAKKKCSCQ